MNKTKCELSLHSLYIKCNISQFDFLTVDRCAGLIDQAVALNYAIGMFGLSPGHVDRRSSKLTEVDKAGGTGGCEGTKNTYRQRLHYCIDFFAQTEHGSLDVNPS